MSKPRRRVRADLESAVARRTRILVVLLAIFAMVATAAATPALAYWSTTGSGSATATTSTLAPPTDVTVPAAAAPDVLVSWTRGSGGVVPTGYLVTRNNGTTTVPACGSSATSLVVATACTDRAVPDGTFTYVVTAIYASWTAPSSSSGAVKVENAVSLAFVVQPTDIFENAAITPAPTVALRTAAGNPFLSAGVQVTIAIGTNPSGGVLTGTTTVLTDAAGVATFAGLSVTKLGVGYTLMATSPGLAPATSGPFTVLGPLLLGAAQSFSILAGTAVTYNTGTTVSGDLGVSPGSSLTGDPMLVGGDVHLADPAAAAAQAALAAAYGDLKGRPNLEIVAEIGNKTFFPGVYHSTAALSLTGTLTLNGNGDPNALFIFQTDAAFNTAANSTVILTNSARAANVYWVVFGAAGTGADSSLFGTILAKAAITVGARTLLIGRALSQAAVTVDASTIRFTTALPPTMAIDGGDAATKDTTPSITGTTNAPNASPVTVRIAGQTLTTTVSGGRWSVTAGELPAGAYLVVAQVRDTSGNATTVSQTLTVEVNPALVNLGSAGDFAVLAATAITNTGATVVTGDVGVSPGTTVTGLGADAVTGTIHAGDAAAAAAQRDLITAFGELSGRTPHTEITGDIGNRTFHLGVHHQTAAIELTGTVTLDAEDNPDAIFIFQTNAAFNTAANSRVTLIRGAQAANVYWVVGDAAGTGANTSLSGTILASHAITLGAGTALTGRALSLAAVTLDANVISKPTLLPAGRPATMAPMVAGDLSAGVGETAAIPSDQAAATTAEPNTTAIPTTEAAAGTASGTSPVTTLAAPSGSSSPASPPEETVSVVGSTEPSASPPSQTTGLGLTTAVSAP
jgi:hypothetical protein